MSKINVAILINRMTGAGPARVASKLSLYLPDEHYNKVIIIYDAENSTYQINGKVINLNTKPSRNPIVRITNTIKRIFVLRRIKVKHKIDVTISLLPNPNLVNILSRKKDKVVISERSFMSKELNGFHGKIYSKIFKFLYNKSDLLIAVSKVVKQDLINQFGIEKNKIKVIYNFYDVENITSLSQEKIDNDELKIFENPTIITVGRLAQQKGQWHLVRAFKKIKKEIPNVQLCILGQGDLQDYLMNLAKDLGVEQDVHFLGFQENPFKYISKSDIYVFPSLYEGFPNALSEAMACGIPVISSDCKSGPREILSPSLDITEPMIKDIMYADYGLMVPTCDGEKYNAYQGLTNEEYLLAEAIVKLFRDEDSLKNYSVLSKERIKDFHKDRIIKEWETIIND